MKKLMVGILVCVLLAPLGAQVVWAGPSAANPLVHIVRWGENLTSIAKRYGTTIQAIVRANNLPNQNRIYAGQRLIISVWTPPPAPSGGVYIVRYGDTLSGIAYRYGVTTSAIMRANGIVNAHRIYRGQRLIIPGPYVPSPTPAPGGTYYVVRWGDTLAKIAMRFRVSTWSVAAANNIANPNVIYPGQRFWIPGYGYTPVSPPVKPECEHLKWPTADAQLSGVVEVKGRANLDDFWYYKIEFRGGGLDEWHYITGAKTAVDDGVLGTWNTWTVGNGTYLFRLVVVDDMGNYPPPCEMSVRVNNGS